MRVLYSIGKRGVEAVSKFSWLEKCLVDRDISVGHLTSGSCSVVAVVMRIYGPRYWMVTSSGSKCCSGIENLAYHSPGL